MGAGHGQGGTTGSAASRAAFATAVRHYLAQTPRQLPSRYLYDALGSALFDAICRLPWYGVTTGEMRLITRHGASIFKHLGPLAGIVELGSGNGDKLAALIGTAPPRLRTIDLHLIDISRAALVTAEAAIGVVAKARVIPYEADYETGLKRFARNRRGRGSMLAMFLGSNIGNYEPEGAAALLRAIHAALRPGDAVLIGVDLVKPEAALQLAYDDPLGVTAAFNRNLLVHINRELDGNFDLDGFHHRAVWNADRSRVEMHLVSSRAQRATIRRARLAVRFKAGEHIWTESSYKFQPKEITKQLTATGFRFRARWRDRASRFSLTLAEV